MTYLVLIFRSVFNVQGCRISPALETALYEIYMSWIFEISVDVRQRMPAENMKASSRLQSFFEIDPAIDVPKVKDTKSVLSSNGGNCSSCN